MDWSLWRSYKIGFGSQSNDVCEWILTIRRNSAKRSRYSKLWPLGKSNDSRTSVTYQGFILNPNARLMFPMYFLTIDKCVSLNRFFQVLRIWRDWTWVRRIWWTFNRVPMNFVRRLLPASRSHAIYKCRLVLSWQAFVVCCKDLVLSGGWQSACSWEDGQFCVAGDSFVICPVYPSFVRNSFPPIAKLVANHTSQKNLNMKYECKGIKHYFPLYIKEPGDVHLFCD